MMVMLASIALVFADEPVQIASGTFNGKNATYTEGWTTTGTGVSRSDCIIIGADENITSPEVDLSQYESISVAIKARRYGTLSGSKAEIAVTFDGEAIGNAVASGTSATTALDVINYEVGDLSTGNFVVTCSNATSAGSTHGAGINSIVITGVLKSQQGGGEDPQPTTRTIYLNGGGASLWNQADAVFFVHAWGGTDVDVLMTQVEGDVYSADIPSDNTSLLFVRMAPGSEAINWDTKWNQSTDQTIPAEKNLFTMTDWSNGTWSVYGETPEPPTPVEAAYYLVGTMNSWQAAEAYKFAAAETEGEYLLHTTLAVGDEIKVIKIEGETTTWYPAEGGNYVVDAAHAGEKDIYFRPAGNEAWAEFGGYIWMGENQPAPVADFTQPFTLKFNGTGTSGSDASGAFAADVAAIFDAASAPYVASVETATKIYAGRPIADDNSSVKFGTSSAKGSFAFTLAQAIEVDSIIVNATQYGNNAAKVTVNGTEFDLTAGNKKPQDCKITPENAVSAITIAQSGSERIYLRNVRVYPKTQGGDTPVEIVLPVVKLAGSLTSWEEPVLMVNAEDSLSASVTLNLGIDDYQLKVVSDGNWLSKAGDGDLYTMHRDWNHVDHLDLINTGDNIKLITDVEGAYTFTWTYADSSLVVTFPEAPAQPKFYITGNEDIVGEGNPTWGKNGALESFSDTLVMNLAAGQHKFKLITPAEQWLGMEALTDTAYGLFTDDDTNICFALAEAGAVTVIYNATEFKVEGNFYVAPKVAYYLIGDSAFVVDAGATADKAWTPDAIASFKDTTVLHLKAGVNYIMRLSLEGTWENHRDFRHLTDTAVGLIELPDEFGNHSIGFSLAEAGDVTIIYIPAANEQPEVFKLIGNFYVAPAPDPTVAVMGSMNNWAEEIPFVLSDDKTYASLTVENIGADNYEFKFVINGEWRSNGYTYHRGFPGAAGITENNDANMIFQADVDGEYTFYWYFANDSAVIVYPELPFVCDWENIAFLGDGSPEQTHANQFKLCKEGEYPGVVNVQKPDFAKESGIYVTFPGAAFGEISLQEGTYAIQGAGMILYCSAFDAQQETEVTVVCDNNPIVFTIYNANYTPAPPTGNIRLVPGVWNLDNAKFAAVTWHVGEAFENGTVSAWFEYLNADTLIGNVPNDADSIAFARFNSAAEVPSMDMSMIWNHTDKLLIDKQTMIYTISGWPEEGRDFCPGYWGEYVEPVYVLENGYYLVGNFSGVDAWSVEDLSAEKKFTANPDNEAEYQLAVNMAENDQVKVAYVENDHIIYWYPKGDNYTVDHNHAGPTTMYFRPDYFDDWNAFGGYFYIVPTSTVDITNVDANAPAVKILRDGQLLIIKGEKMYNVMGQTIK